MFKIFDDLLRERREASEDKKSIVSAFENFVQNNPQIPTYKSSLGVFGKLSVDSSQDMPYRLQIGSLDHPVNLNNYIFYDNIVDLRKSLEKCGTMMGGEKREVSGRSHIFLNGIDISWITAEQNSIYLELKIEAKSPKDLVTLFETMLPISQEYRKRLDQEEQRISEDIKTEFASAGRESLSWLNPKVEDVPKEQPPNIRGKRDVSYSGKTDSKPTVA